MKRCLEYTGVQAVLVAEALLCNPALFYCAPVQRSSVFTALVNRTDDENEVLPRPPSATELTTEYIRFAEMHPPSDFLKIVKPHIFRMLFKILNGIPEPSMESGHSEGFEPEVGCQSDMTRKTEEQRLKQVHVHLTDQLQKAKTLEDCKCVVASVEMALKSLGGTLSEELDSAAAESPLSWYFRHRRHKASGSSASALMWDTKSPLEQKKRNAAQKMKWLESGTRMF